MSQRDERLYEAYRVYFRKYVSVNAHVLNSRPPSVEELWSEFAAVLGQATQPFALNPRFVESQPTIKAWFVEFIEEYRRRVDGTK
jgi:hypothetical protein